jgi:hypothetical protein
MRGNNWDFDSFSQGFSKTNKSHIVSNELKYKVLKNCDNPCE